jgi:hypothetical protein
VRVRNGGWLDGHAITFRASSAIDLSGRSRLIEQ